jgi:alkanesulfonate monooxygenase SsuD/methylene tetrahydromethanopterin reductase-like flavin-dependent oxidoreductase (luciferase family)
MMRISFLPSDFNPMILMLGEAEDCRALGGVLRCFARDGAEVSFAGLGFCQVTGPDVLLVAASGEAGVRQGGRNALVWRLPQNLAASFADRLEDLAGARRIAGSEELRCGAEDGITVTVSRGEYADDFLNGG